MIRIGILGDIGSGKSYFANNFGYPVFNADYEVSKLYKKDKKTFIKLKKKLPEYIYSFPVNKTKNKKIVILDIPLLLENKINNKKDILVFIEAKKGDIEKKLKKRKNFNRELLNEFRKIQFKSDYKKMKSHFIIKNNFKKKNTNESIKNILNDIL